MSWSMPARYLSRAWDVVALPSISRPKRRRATGVRNSWDTARTSSRWIANSCCRCSAMPLKAAARRPTESAPRAGTRVSRLPWAIWVAADSRPRKRRSNWRTNR
ncbi:hypothetical protein D3C84_933960 [compost metagenome]